MNDFKRSVALLAICLLGSEAAIAESEGEGRGQGDRSRPGKPPQAAFDACVSSSANAICSVQTPRGDVVSGQCLTPPQQQTLVCVPDHHRQQRSRQPSQQPSQQEGLPQAGSGRDASPLRQP